MNPLLVAIEQPGLPSMNKPRQLEKAGISCRIATDDLLNIKSIEKERDLKFGLQCWLA